MFKGTFTMFWTNGYAMQIRPDNFFIGDVSELNTFLQKMCIQHGFYYINKEGENQYLFELTGKLQYDGDLSVCKNELIIKRLPLKETALMRGDKEPDCYNKWKFADSYRDSEDGYPRFILGDDLMKQLGFTELDRETMSYNGYVKLSQRI
jgi:hypothetical protein